MNSFTVTELKKLEGESYEEVGVVGGDSSPVVWSNSTYAHPFSFSLINDFEVRQSNFQTSVGCHAICADNVSILKRLTEQTGDYGELTIDKGLGCWPVDTWRPLWLSRSV